MLVISRKQGESLLIGQDVELLIVKTQGGRVKLAITAPSHVIIRRGELPPDVGTARRPQSRSSASAPLPVKSRS